MNVDALHEALARDDAADVLAAMQLSRRTGDRRRDVPDDQRQEVLAWLAERSAPTHYVELVREGGQLDVEEQGQIIGESLPKGLRVV